MLQLRFKKKKSLSAL